MWPIRAYRRCWAAQASAGAFLKAPEVGSPLNKRRRTKLSSSLTALVLIWAGSAKARGRPVVEQRQHRFPSGWVTYSGTWSQLGLEPEIHVLASSLRLAYPDVLLTCEK
jgi:hypothetical protein